MEIVTWVLRGSLVHQDSTGHSGVIYPGLAQRMSAGRGILHSEKNDSWTLTGDAIATASQCISCRCGWCPTSPASRPDTSSSRSTTSCSAAGWSPSPRACPSTRDDTAITIRNRYAALHGARLQPGDSVELPQAPYLHLFVPRGEVTLEGAGPLHEGDAVRFTASGGQRVTATEPSEILVWEMHAGLAAA